jgi:hypothetical protein
METNKAANSSAASMIETIQVRPLRLSDPEVIAEAFRAIGWNKPPSQYRCYLNERYGLAGQIEAEKVTITLEPGKP